MHIVAFSMTPLFPNRVMGGAQKQLYAVVMHLAERGHRVTLLCTRRPPDLTEPFYWHENAQIVPIFRFKQPYPEPYATPIFNIANAIQDLSEYLATADVFYSHDGGFIFPYVMQHIPTVVSLRSLIFSETLQSAFLFQGDALILISHYQRDTILQTVGRFFPDLTARTPVIYNGLNFDQFRPTDYSTILHKFPTLDPTRHTIALFPHRPEAAKGIFETIELARRLVYEQGMAHLRVLVPRWIESALSPEDRAYYDGLLATIAQNGVSENFIFHEWLSQAEMPAYYSMGGVTLAIGRYVETFGNVPYESLACGTPAIVARVGPARELLPDALLDKVDAGDVAAAVGIAARILSARERTSVATLDYLQARFSLTEMTSAYADVILNAAKRPPMPYHPAPLTDASRLAIPAWVTMPNGKRLYHDLTEQITDAPDLLLLHRRLMAGESITLGEAGAQARAWIADGWIVT
ncbi:MAG: glycosyltransferase family 4 protein [Phototrophicaceae bacterium]|jgi:glycosyltransferase involved in cell wall biosynthesis